MNKANYIVFNESVCQRLLWSNMNEDVYFEIINGTINLIVKQLNSVCKTIRIPNNNLKSILSRKHKSLLVSNNINRIYNEEEK